MRDFYRGYLRGTGGLDDGSHSPGSKFVAGALSRGVDALRNYTIFRIGGNQQTRNLGTFHASDSVRAMRTCSSIICQIYIA